MKRQIRLLQILPTRLRRPSLAILRAYRAHRHVQGALEELHLQRISLGVLFRDPLPIKEQFPFEPHRRGVRHGALLASVRPLFFPKLIPAIRTRQTFQFAHAENTVDDCRIKSFIILLRVHFLFRARRALRPKDVSPRIVKVLFQIAESAILRTDLDECEAVGKRSRIGQDILDAVVRNRLFCAFITEARLDPAVDDRRHCTLQPCDIQTLDDRDFIRRKILAVLRIRCQPIPFFRRIGRSKSAARHDSKKKHGNDRATEFLPCVFQGDSPFSL